MTRAVAIIPARYGSSRFPGKPLADRTGKPLIQHVYERAILARSVTRVLIATDDERIASAVRAFGGEPVMTRADHPNGTSRLAEVALGLDAEIVVNVQGDEPDLDPALIDLGVETLIHNPEAQVATIASPFALNENPANPNIVKVVCDLRGSALYFSRSLIPYDRDDIGNGGDSANFRGGALKHVGLYVYRRGFLLSYPDLAPTPLEKAEHLEQLRVLEHGYSIAVAVAETHSHGIDTPEQYDAFVERSMRDGAS